MHSRTKHIEIRHPFLRDHVSKGDCYIEFVDNEHQLAEIFTKLLARDRFFFIRNELGILDGFSIEWYYVLVHVACYICPLCLLFMFNILAFWYVVEYLLKKYVLLYHFVFFIVLIDYMFGLKLFLALCSVVIYYCLVLINYMLWFMAYFGFVLCFNRLQRPQGEFF